MRVILSTHSPFIVRGAPAEAKIFWLNNGKVESTNRKVVELALGWGAFGKKVIFISEDSNNDPLKSIVSQWPELERSIAFLPGNGYKSIPTPSQVAELSKSLGGSFKIFVHRDRDSLTDDEVLNLQKQYKSVDAML